MRTVDGGVWLLSAWLDMNLQLRHCRIKDWRYSQVAQEVCDLVFAMNGCVMLCGVSGLGCRDSIGLKGTRFELSLPIADALCMRRREWLEQRCGYFRCEQWTVEHGCSQRGSKRSCSYVTAESRIGSIRRRRRYRFVIYFRNERLHLVD